MSKKGIVHQQLDLAENTWRDVVRTEYPLFLDLKVVKADPDPKKERHWMFYTDMTTSHMDVFKPDLIEKLFRETIVPMYKEAYSQLNVSEEELVVRLLHDNFFYLYSHEQYHPTFCPNSKLDEKKFDEALYLGIQKAQPGLKEPDILRKVGNVRNAGWDQVIDGAFFTFSNQGSLEQRINTVMESSMPPQKQLQTALQTSTPPTTTQQTAIPQVVPTHLPDAVVPIFDILEFETQTKKFDSLFYPLSRAIYGMLFCGTAKMRGPIFDYFKQRIIKQMPEKEFDEVLKKAVSGFVGELTPEQLKYLRLEKADFKRNVDQVFSNYQNPAIDSAHQELTSDLNRILLEKDLEIRYAAIRGFIQPLAKYISLTQEEKRHGTHIGQGQGSGQPGQGQPSPGQGQPQPGQGQQPGQGTGDPQTGQNQPGGNTEAALLNLADILNEQQANALLSAVANESGNKPGGQAGGQAQKDKRLSNLAKDEYYKRNVPELSIKSPNYEAVSVDLGKKRVPVYISTLSLTSQELVQMDLEQIMRFQEETGIVTLSQISDYEFRLDQYEWQEKDEIDYKFENTDLELPDNVVFHVDSSGSMGGPNYVGTGQPYDTLMHVCFATLKSLLKAAQDMKKEVNIIAANYSNGTILSDAVELQHMYNTPNNGAKLALLGFQGGGTDYSADTFAKMNSKLKPGKTVHVWVTDGELSPGCVQSTFNQIQSAVQSPNTSFLYFEIGSRSSFGSSLERLFQQFPNGQYLPNVTIQQIQSKALEVMLQYQ
ncbi:hypothetical protein J4437_06245 [Candidatus Woesearchaeota archaeon]|nr:hypothetical protein [Candidatus Woesearchaeota archaeon]